MKILLMIDFAPRRGPVTRPPLRQTPSEDGFSCSASDPLLKVTELMIAPAKKRVVIVDRKPFTLWGGRLRSRLFPPRASV